MGFRVRCFFLFVLLFGGGGGGDGGTKGIGVREGVGFGGFRVLGLK